MAISSRLSELELSEETGTLTCVSAKSDIPDPNGQPLLRQHYNVKIPCDTATQCVS